jgi:hypothetical protein
MATNSAAAGRHQTLARIWQAMHAKAGYVAETLAAAQETRRQWAALLRLLDASCTCTTSTVTSSPCTYPVSPWR